MNKKKIARALATVALVAAAAGLFWAGWTYNVPQRLMDRAFVFLGWGETGSFDGQPQTSSLANDADQRGEVTLDPGRRQLIGVQTVVAEERAIDRTIRAVGIVKPDERRLVDVNVKLDGWIRQLRVDYTGRFVRQGDPLFTLYSPELAATQQEYLLARASRDDVAASPVPDARSYADRLVEAAERRLQRWDISADQIAEMAERRATDGLVTLRSPASGYVVEKMAIEGMHAEAGQTLYRIADLSVVWVEASVYEQDLAAVQVGQQAVVSIDSLPGVEIAGRVVYIPPSLNLETRTAQVRFEFANGSGRLKPGMFATVAIHAPVQSGLVVPENAVLDSGARKLVFVDRGEGRFEPREVKTGAHANGQVLVLSGLQPGDRVASSAVFLIDSESQLRAALQTFESPAGASGGPASPATAATVIAFHSSPDPARVGENTFEVTVKGADEKPIDEARVEVTLFMPAMPTMNMPPMRNQVIVPRVTAGVYRGPGQVLMAGQWQVTVTASRGGHRIGSLQTTLVTQ